MNPGLLARPHRGHTGAAHDDVTALVKPGSVPGRGSRTPDATGSSDVLRPVDPHLDLRASRPLDWLDSGRAASVRGCVDLHARGLVRPGAPTRLPDRRRGHCRLPLLQALQSVQRRTTRSSTKSTSSVRRLARTARTRQSLRLQRVLRCAPGAQAVVTLIAAPAISAVGEPGSSDRAWTEDRRAPAVRDREEPARRQARPSRIGRARPSAARASGRSLRPVGPDARTTPERPGSAARADPHGF